MSPSVNEKSPVTKKKGGKKVEPLAISKDSIMNEFEINSVAVSSVIPNSTYSNIAQELTPQSISNKVKLSTS